MTPSRPSRDLIALATAVFTTVATATTLAADGLASTAEAGLGMCAGSLTYGFELTGYDSRVGRRLVVQSILEWPLPTSVAHGAWRLSLPRGRTGHYGARLSLSSSLDQPHGAMKDSDWAAPADAPDQNARFSYLESDVSGRMLVADLGLWLAFDREATGRDSLVLLTGYRHEYFSYLASNMRGWQWAHRERIPVASGSPVLDLRTQLILPYVGGRWHARAFSGLLSGSLELGASVAFASVRDDHLQRHKVLEGNAVGWGLMVRSEPRIHFARFWNAGLDLEWQLVRADWGTIEQHYYADDPTLNGDQTGQDIATVPFYARGLRYTAVVVVGFEIR